MEGCSMRSDPKKSDHLHQYKTFRMAHWWSIEVSVNERAKALEQTRSGRNRQMKLYLRATRRLRLRRETAGNDPSVTRCVGNNHRQEKIWDACTGPVRIPGLLIRGRTEDLES
jgi:hypothetical protein